MTTPTPFRLRVQKAITAQLKTISRSADIYNYDLSTSVFRGRGVFGNSDPLPMLSIIEDVRQLDDSLQAVAPQQSTGSENDYALIIQGFIQDDPENPTDPGHYLLADTKAALYAAKADRYNILGLGHRKPCVIDLHVGSGVIRPPDMEISGKTYFLLPIRLKLVEDGADAFT